MSVLINTVLEYLVNQDVLFRLLVQERERHDNFRVLICFKCVFTGIGVLETVVWVYVCMETWEWDMTESKHGNWT